METFGPSVHSESLCFPICKCGSILSKPFISLAPLPHGEWVGVTWHSASPRSCSKTAQQLGVIRNLVNVWRDSKIDQNVQQSLTQALGILPCLLYLGYKSCVVLPLKMFLSVACLWPLFPSPDEDTASAPSPPQGAPSRQPFVWTLSNWSETYRYPTLPSLAETSPWLPAVLEVKFKPCRDFYSFLPLDLHSPQGRNGLFISVSLMHGKVSGA